MNRDDYQAREAQRKADEAKHHAGNERHRQAMENKADFHANERKKTMDAWEKSGTGNGSGCFPKGTRIATPFGLRDISTFREGDPVIAVNRRNGQKQTRRVLRKATHADHSIWVLVFSDGSSVRTTSVHSFAVGAGWKKASRIEPGERISTFDRDAGLGEKIVAASYPKNAAEDVYNLIVEADFSFVADGVLAHSFTYLRALRVWAWTLRAAARLFSERIGSVLKPARKINA